MTKKEITDILLEVGYEETRTFTNSSEWSLMGTIGVSEHRAKMSRFKGQKLKVGEKIKATFARVSFSYYGEEEKIDLVERVPISSVSRKEFLEYLLSNTPANSDAQSRIKSIIRRDKLNDLLNND